MQQKRSEMVALHAIGDCSRDSVCSFAGSAVQCCFIVLWGLDLLLRQLLFLVGCTETFPLQLIARPLGPRNKRRQDSKNPSEDISDYYPGIKTKKAGCSRMEVKRWLCTQLGIAPGIPFALFLQRVQRNVASLFCVGIPARASKLMLQLTLQSRLNKQHATHVLKTFSASFAPNSCRNVLRPECANTLSRVYLPSPFPTAPREKECSVNGCYSSNASHCKLRLLIKSPDQLTSDRSP
ncbi:hypothetical protein CEXT_26341 [Caerostris extrusa]|uniref:Uncharacterized protein n=1 Tax=Caerostris extrusa TaxID=172846 RepID=A0AAV4QRU9_CAEEX|nr:hypothetical protein CEXT_26341 [Caerostris extrusa]